MCGWTGQPNSASDLAKSILAKERVLVADHTLFGVEDGAAGGGLRVGLGPVDMPDRLAALELGGAPRARASG